MCLMACVEITDKCFCQTGCLMVLMRIWLCPFTLYHISRRNVTYETLPHVGPALPLEQIITDPKSTRNDCFATMWM